MAKSSFKFTDEHEEYLEQYIEKYEEARKVAKAQRTAAEQRVAQSVTGEFVKKFKLDPQAARRLRHVCAQNMSS